MTVKETMPAPEASEVTCRDCKLPQRSGAQVTCLRCHHKDIRATEFDERQQAAKRIDTRALRAWTARRHLMGHISREVREQLELCADDIEVGHG